MKRYPLSDVELAFKELYGFGLPKMVLPIANREGLTFKPDGPKPAVDLPEAATLQLSLQAYFQVPENTYRLLECVQPGLSSFLSMHWTDQVRVLVTTQTV